MGDFTEYFEEKSTQKYEKSQKFSFALRVVSFGDKFLTQMEGFFNISKENPLKSMKI